MGGCLIPILPIERPLKLLGIVLEILIKLILDECTILFRLCCPCVMERFGKARNCQISAYRLLASSALGNAWNPCKIRRCLISDYNSKLCTVTTIDIVLTWNNGNYLNEMIVFAWVECSFPSPTHTHTAGKMVNFRWVPSSLKIE